MALRAAALLLAIVVVAAGCSQRSAAQTSLTVALALLPEEATRYQTFVGEFERRTGIHVALVAQGYGDILRSLQAEALGGRGSLDLVELDVSMLTEAQPWVRDLHPLPTPSARPLFPAAAWEPATTDGHVFFVPHRLTWQAMIYDRVRVPQPPRTWDELQRFAAQHPGRVALKGALYEGVVCDVWPFIWAGGGSDPLSPDSAGAVRALGYLQHIGPDLNDFSPVFREMSVLEAQARGTVWIHFNWPFAMSYLQAKGLAPSVDLSAPIPAGPAGAFTTLGGGYLGVPISAPHPAAAREFLRYLLTADTQQRLSRELGWFGSVPPPEGSEEARLYQGFTAMRTSTRARPARQCYAQSSDRWRRAFRSVIFAGESPRDALAAIAREGGSALCECRQASRAGRSGGRSERP